VRFSILIGIGRSRSATIILSYLMKYENMNLKQAWLYLKERRRIIMPNAGTLYEFIYSFPCLSRRFSLTP
jgi:protein-tyrosine phosphatase